MKNSTFLTLLLFIIVSPNLFSQQQGFGCIKDMKLLSISGIEKYSTNSKPITEFMPMFGKTAKKNDRSFSLPFGVGFHSIFYDQGYTASNLQLKSDSSAFTARADTMYQKTTAYELKGSIRPNIWLFSFLNVYGVFGYTKGVISPNLVIPYVMIENPLIIDTIRVDTTFEIKDEIGYVGPTYGIGATFSMGFDYFFIMADYNYSITNPTDLEENLHNHFFSPKVGVLLGKSKKKIFGAMWLGAMFISNDQSFSGKIDVADINSAFIPLLGEEAEYSGDISANNRWNIVIGGSIVINHHHHLTLEVGFLERKQISFGYDFRF